jgi:hypothetical protein
LRESAAILAGGHYPAVGVVGQDQESELVADAGANGAVRGAI